jgi:L-lactate dehydrogenase (cytochrome)
MTAKALNIDDVRDQACRRLPRGIFQYIDRGAEDEVGLANLRRAFDEVTFNPRVLADVSGRNLETSLLGRPQPMPLAIAPTAAAGLVWHEGEIALARAASKAEYLSASRPARSPPWSGSLKRARVRCGSSSMYGMTARSPTR